MRQLSLALLLLTAACEKHEAPPRPNKPTASNPSGNPLTASGALTVPRTLQVRSGSDKGPSWSVTLEGMGSVAWRYEQRGNREKGARFGTMMIPVERWKVFREALDEAGAFELQKRYVGQSAEAGDWSISVDFGDKSVKSEGLQGGGPEGAPPSKIFAAVDMLVDHKLR